MTSNQDKCGLSHLLPMSCRGRAEAFARHLQSRLSSLGSNQNGTNGQADENSWLGASVRPETHPIASSQPRTSSESNELYFDLDAFESPGSPEEDVDTQEMHKLFNKDNLKLPHSQDCHCSNEKNISLLDCVKTTSNDSDSSDIFFDTDNATHVNGIDHDNSSNQMEETFLTTSECTISSSLSEGLSNCSLNRDDECPSLNSNEFSSEIPQSDNFTIESELNGDKNKEEVLVVVEVNEETQRLTDKTYTSNLKVEEDLTVECPNVKVVAEVNKEPKTNSIIENDEDEEEERIPRIRRCSSLKTGKTPPGTPGHKKIVRFADVLGLDLADVRTFLDEIPKVPTSAYEDLKDVDLDSDVQLNQRKFSLNCPSSTEKVLVILFQQPGGLANFIDRIRYQNVCLENAFVEDPIALSIRGTVRVKNLDFHKSVHIRYSLDSWQSFADVKATYVENSCDGFSDKFAFLMYANTLGIGQRLEFAVRFQCKGSQYWDNNNGVNYCFQCLPSTSSSTFQPITSVDEGWPESFYYSEDKEDILNNNDDDDDDNGEEEVEEETITRMAIQELIMQSLEIKNETPNKTEKRKTDTWTIITILIICFLFLYLRSTCLEYFS